MKKRLSPWPLFVIAVALALTLTPVNADNAFAGYWSGQETFTINSVLGGPPESGTTDVPRLFVTPDGTLYTAGRSPGGLGLSGTVGAGGQFAGTYITDDGSRFNITGLFASGHATLTKQPVVPNGSSGVNITFELTFTGRAATSLQPSSGGPMAFLQDLTPVQMVTIVVAALAALGLLSAILRLVARTLAPRPRANYRMGKATHKPPQAQSKVLRHGATYRDTSQPAATPASPSTSPSQPPHLIGTEDGASGMAILGQGAYAMPVNQGRLNAQAGAARFGVGNPWQNGVIDQPDANYYPEITPSWTTGYTCKTYSDHFFVDFANPAPANAYFTWRLMRPNNR